jgi:hypothetical protein
MNSNESEYIRRDDETEADMTQDTQGVGEPLYLGPNDIRSYALEGFGLNDPARGD